jgi:tRNA-dihydrouridine synthase B
MISAKGLFYNDKATERLLSLHEDEKPAAFQIFGSEPDVVAFAADKLAERGNVILDINMGCPVPKIVRNGDGSALLKNPPLIGKIVKAAVRAAGKPVTAKIRLGWDDSSINVLETAKIIEDAGASALAVHGRTREQYYSGKADWDQLRQVKEAISIPLIGNGDVFSGEDAIKMLEYTGCDFVMIARGAYGNPWIFRDAAALWQGAAKPAPPDLAEKTAMALWHFQMLCSEKGERIAVKEMRKHIGWYFKGVPHATELRRKANTISCAAELESLLKNTIGTISLV